MGTKVPKSIDDYPSFGLDLGIRCAGCNRVAVFKPVDVVAFFAVRNLSTRLPVNVSVFSCKCGSRELTAIAVPVGRRPAPSEMYGRMMQPIYVLKGRG